MPRANPKPIGRRLAGKYRMLRRWKRCWQEQPERMERARRRNVAKAHEHYRELNDNLRQYLAGWPRIMTSPEFLQRVKDSIPLLGRGRTRKGYDWKSFRARLVRLNLCTFDKQTRMWTNTSAEPIE